MNIEIEPLGILTAALHFFDLKQNPGDSFSPAGFKDVRQSIEQA